MNFLHRMLARAAGQSRVEAGEELSLSVDLALAHDGSADALLSHWPQNGRVAQPEKTVIAVDHFLPAPHVSARELHLRLMEFAQKQKVHLYNRGEGVLHQVVAERFTPGPGWIIAGADGHVATAGAFGAAAFSVSPEQLVTVLLTGRLAVTVPEIFTVEISGPLSPAATARDIGLALLGRLGQGMVKGKALIIRGEGVCGLSPSGKMSICNLIGETGAVTGLIAPAADVDDVSRADLRIEGASLEPMIACPPTPSNVRPLKDIAGLPLTQALVGGCSSGRVEDMRELLQGLAGRPVHRDVTLLVAPASQEVLSRMEELGLSRDLRGLGALLLPPGCGPCPGKHLGLIARNDRVLAATVRNTPGRMGSEEGEIYLASPRTVGASASAGAIAIPHQRSK
jgi:3-isopropylmalate/(R)-2-methylmalate dehydratase large subunit